MDDIWRCKKQGCNGALGEILRDKQGRVTWLRVGRVRLSAGWVDCPKCGRSRFWISPDGKAKVTRVARVAKVARWSGTNCDCGSGLCPVCNPVRVANMVYGAGSKHE